MKQTTTTDTIQEEIEKILLASNLRAIADEPDETRSIDIATKQLLALFESAISKTREETAEEICVLIDKIESTSQTNTLEEWKQYKAIRNAIRDNYVYAEQKLDDQWEKFDCGEIISDDLFDRVFDLLKDAISKTREETERNWKAKGYVNATPDGNYALRLLQQAREDCNVSWSDNTAGIPSDNPLIVEMNRHNVERAKELDKAIASLKKKQTKV